MREKYEVVIGLEVHAQLKTASKIFCSCSTAFGAEPNSHTCPVCLGLPGALPVLNGTAIEMAARAALALNLRINHESIFSRKNYFYPDLPKGYQISQYDRPFSEHGWVEIPTAERNDAGHAKEWRLKKFGITRLHIEEDAGKSLHEGLRESSSKSYVDLNRSGVPLAEIVSEPDFRSSWEAYDYIQYLRRTLLYVDVCDGNMEEGNLRCDANVSIRTRGSERFGTKVELKNLNSFRFVQKALEYEIDRQIAVVEAGDRVVQETRLWNEREARTYSMRSKEEAHDYRYFPEPDLPPIVVAVDQVARVREALPELPEPRRRRFVEEYGLAFDDAAQLVDNRATADFFEETARDSGNPKAAANWILNELARELKSSGTEITESPLKSDNLSEMIRMIDSGAISGKMAKEVLTEMCRSGAPAAEIVKGMGGGQVSDESQIREIAARVVESNPKQLDEYRAGRTALLGFFVGQVIKQSGGRANPRIVNEVVKEILER
ncbi:MAG: Asp-tRNA(Asn)/Glu-tRNA(Gln) amidotransferase GatCAB subunit B [Blastocatellia bacterium AA13]|nr:MAG: Asp-tRNA(Asn)/Glu-tRNA(Gln) amidotransferase GatCAB subunit B [Blastocatellia bacterium AA13]